MGVTGMGGGALTTPVLLLFGVPPVTAVGSDLGFATVVRALGAFLHGRKSNIDFKLVLFILAGSIPASIASYFMLPFLRGRLGLDGFDSLLSESLAIILVLVSVISISRRVYSAKKKETSTIQTATILEKEIVDFSNLTREKKCLILVGGIFVGFAVQFTSVGSGSILIFILMFVFRSKKIVGSDLFHAFILTSIGTFLHASLGDVNPTLLLNLVAGGLPGMLVGVRFVSFITFNRLKDLLNVGVMVAGFTLLLHLVL
jgi:uncharacterized membrane protein YfcA